MDVGGTNGRHTLSQRRRGGFFGALLQKESFQHFKKTIPRKALSSFQHFTVGGAAVFDRKSSRNGVFSEALSPTPIPPLGPSLSPSPRIARKHSTKQQAYEEADGGGSRCVSASPDLLRASRCSTATPATPDLLLPSRCSTATPAMSDICEGDVGNSTTLTMQASSTIPETPDLTTFSSSSSRPGTRQGTRRGEAQQELIDAKQEIGESKFINIVLQGRMKQEYWDGYSDIENPKNVLSDFEEYMRKLRDDVEDGDIMVSDMNSNMVGFTVRTPREELLSSYARRCRETYTLPLGPRQRVGMQKENSAAQLSTPDMLLYGGWSLGSDRLDELWNTSCQGMRGCRHINLSGNRLEDRSIPLVCNVLLPTIETLNLSNNLLSHRGARHLADAIKVPRDVCPLLELNLDNNMLGEVIEGDVCSLMETLGALCPQLRALSLSKNELGKVDGSVGEAIGKMLISASKLKVLDLHWNHFGGLGAYNLLQGVYDNGLQNGQLSRVDLSWNRLGFVDPARPHANPAKVLSDVLQDNKTLFHFDISYNQLGVEACRVIAAGIRQNQTLLGFHIAGNAAAIDPNGFVVAHENPNAISPALVNPDTVSFVDPGALSQRSHVNTVVRKPTLEPGTPSASRAHMIRHKNTRFIASDEHVVGLIKNIGEHPLGSVHQRAECCWICDRWRPVQLTWTPGISGVAQEAEVDSVNAFLSIDSFRRSIPLMRKPKSVSASRETWQNHFMLPPNTTASPLLVIFQVNGCLQCARDMPTRVLAHPIRIGTPTGGESEIAGQGTKEVPTGDGKRHSTKGSSHSTVSMANEVPVMPQDEQRPPASWERQPLVVTEDLVVHGQLLVLPRNITATATKVVHKWSRAVSVWASWVEESENLWEKMLDADLNLAKTDKIVSNFSEQKLKRSILPFYGALISTYRVMSVQGSGHAIFGITYNSLVTIGNAAKLFDESLPERTLVNASIAACVVDKRHSTIVRVRADNIIIRYQFVETLLRAAHAKYVASSRADDLCEASQKLCQDLEEYVGETRKDIEYFYKVYFIEEMDLVYKGYLHVLQVAYEIYSQVEARIDGNGMMSLPGWMQFLNDCEAFDDVFARRKASRAFAFGLMWQVDELSTERHMHLSFVEFLVAIGAVVYMRRFWHEEEFSDLVEEFLEEHIAVVVDAKASQEQKDTMAAKSRKHQAETGRPMHISKAELRYSFESVFKIADEDGNGTLTLREFKNAFRNPKVLSVLGGRDTKVEDFIRIFDTLDDDGNHSLTVEEAMIGFGAMRRLERTVDRSKAFLENLCESSGAIQDEDGVSCAALMVIMRRSATQRKLMRLSWVPADIFKYLTGFDETPQILTRETLVAEVMALRTGKAIPKWKIVLKQIFEDADKDHGGSVSKNEWRKIMESPSVQHKFEKCGISKAIIENCFKFLDHDGSDDLSEDELVDGCAQLFEQGLIGKPHEQQEDDKLAARDKRRDSMQGSKLPRIQGKDGEQSTKKGKSKDRKSVKVRVSVTAEMSDALNATAENMGGSGQRKSLAAVDEAGLASLTGSRKSVSRKSISGSAGDAKGRNRRPSVAQNRRTSSDIP